MPSEAAVASFGDWSAARKSPKHCRGIPVLAPDVGEKTAAKMPRQGKREAATIPKNPKTPQKDGEGNKNRKEVLSASKFLKIWVIKNGERQPSQNGDESLKWWNATNAQIRITLKDRTRRLS